MTKKERHKVGPGPPSRNWRNNGGQATDGLADPLPVSNGEACPLQLGAAAILKPDTVAVAQFNAQKMTTRPPYAHTSLCLLCGI